MENVMKSHAIHKARVTLVKFIARYPFEEMRYAKNKLDGGQIIGVDFSTQKIKLRDFCDYDISELAKDYVFRNARINKLWAERVKIYFKTIL